MEVNDELVRNLAELALLEFSDEEMQSIKVDLQRMISFVEKLNELDTTGVQPLLHMGDSQNAYRDDIIQGSVPREAGLKNAPATDGTYFMVPKVIKK